MNTWEKIRHLIGREMETSDRKKKFKIDAVGTDFLVVSTEDNNPHPLRRTEIERAVEMQQTISNFARSHLVEGFPGNRTTSYMLAICLELAKQTVR